MQTTSTTGEGKEARQLEKKIGGKFKWFNTKIKTKYREHLRYTILQET